jgi:hypothetical protein
MEEIAEAWRRIVTEKGGAIVGDVDVINGVRYVTICWLRATLGDQVCTILLIATAGALHVMETNRIPSRLCGTLLSHGVVDVFRLNTMGFRLR